MNNNYFTTNSVGYYCFFFYNLVYLTMLDIAGRNFYNVFYLTKLGIAGRIFYNLFYLTMLDIAGRVFL